MDNYNRLDVPIFSDDQKDKDVKKSTPGNTFKGGRPLTKGDQVFIKDGTKSIVFDYVLDTSIRYYFIGYDKYDNSCYVSKDPSGNMCYNVTLKSVLLCEPIDQIIKSGIKSNKIHQVFDEHEVYEKIIAAVDANCTDVRKGGCGFYYIFKYDELNTPEEKEDWGLFASLNYKGKPIFRVSSNGGGSYTGFNINFIYNNLKSI